eukprot:COSAG01_NODE_47110_length_393_cov_1.435374_2_plen_27_part_01
MLVFRMVRATVIRPASAEASWLGTLCA